MAKRGPKAFHDLSKVACPNPACPNFGRPGAAGLVANGAYQTQSGKRRRFICRACGKSFCSSAGAIFHDLRVPEEKVLTALKLLLKGVSVRKCAELIGAHPQTIRAWLRIAAENRAGATQALLAEPGVTPPQLEALWRDLADQQLHQRAVIWRKRRGWTTPDRK